MTEARNGNIPGLCFVIQTEGPSNGRQPETKKVKRLIAPLATLATERTGTQMRPLTCEEAAQRLHTFLDRELDVKEVAEVRTHLENCSECQSKFRFEASINRVVRSRASRQRAPIGLREKIVDRTGQSDGRRRS